MALRVQRERLEGAGAPSEAAYAARWGLTEERLARACPGRHRDAPGSGQRGRRAAAGCGLGAALGHHPPGRQRRARPHGRHGTASSASRHDAGRRRSPRARSWVASPSRTRWLVDPPRGGRGMGPCSSRTGCWSRWSGRPGRGLAQGRLGRRRAGVHRPARPHPRARRRGGGDRSRPASPRRRTVASRFVATMADTRPPVDRPEVVQRVLRGGCRDRVRGAHPAVGRVDGRVARARCSRRSHRSRRPGSWASATCRARPRLRRCSAQRSRRRAPSRCRSWCTPTSHRSPRARRRTRDCRRPSSGCSGASAAAEVSAVARAVAVLRQVSAEAPPDVHPHLHLAHLSAAGSLDAVRGARTEGLRVTCDVSAAASRAP